MSQIHSAGGIVRNEKGEIALILHDGEYWGFPKGVIEEGETPLEAARREIGEEAGITDLALKKEFPPYERPRGKDAGKPNPRMKTIHMFLFDTPQEKFVLTEPRHTAGRWEPVDAVASLLWNEKDREFFEGIKDSLK
jgi:8-oxo-dGTP pyrophosphatase MutT (NUDIX family)